MWLSYLVVWPNLMPPLILTPWTSFLPNSDRGDFLSRTAVPFKLLFLKPGVWVFLAYYFEEIQGFYLQKLKICFLRVQATLQRSQLVKKCSCIGLLAINLRPLENTKVKKNLEPPLSLFLLPTIHTNRKEYS